MEAEKSGAKLRARAPGSPGVIAATDWFRVGGITFALTLIVGLWFGVEAQIARERATKIEDVMRANANLARTFEEHTIRTLGYVDAILIALQRQYETQGAKFDLTKFYADLNPSAAVLRNVVITDETGTIILSTPPAPRISLADREHVKVHEARDTKRMFISKPVLARVNKQWSIVVTRRANKPDGSFAGVVSLAINPFYFSNFYQDVNLGQQVLVSLIGTDGIVRARLSRNNTEIGLDASQSAAVKRLMTPGAPISDSYVATTLADGVERISSARKLHDYPLLVTVGTGMDESLARETARAQTYRTALAVSSVAIAAAVSLFVWFNLRRQRAQLAFRMSQFSVEHASLATFWNGPDAQILQVNLAAGQLLGYTEQELLSMKITALDPDFPEERWPLHWQELRERQHMNFESQLRHKDGHLISVEVDLNRMELDALEFNCAFVRDITARRQAEQSLRASTARAEQASRDLAEQHHLLSLLLRTTQQGYWFIDNEGVTTDANPAMCSLLGRSREEVIGHSAFDFFKGPDWQILHDELEARKRGKTGSYEIGILRPDGTRAHCVNSATPLYNLQGTKVGSVGLWTDITGRRESELVLESLLREKEALLKEVHHRVKNNLQVINSLLRLESGRSQVPSTKAAFGDMQSRIRSMALLHESLYRSGAFAAVDLATYLAQLAKESFRALDARTGSIQLALDLASVSMSMDQALPCGLFVNELLSNSLKHGFPAGSIGEVSIQLKNLDDAGNLLLRVSDTGVGLPPDFDARRGQSLGLQMVSDLAGQLNGVLEITPQTPTGVAFSVMFAVEKPLTDLRSGSMGTVS